MNLDLQDVPTDTGLSKIFSLNGRRPMVVVKINSVNVPFYISTGRGGKENVETGKWYPVFGIGPDGWLNKGSQGAINTYYGSPIFEKISEILDCKLGDLRDDPRLPLVDSFEDEEALSVINKDINPVAHGSDEDGEYDNQLDIQLRTRVTDHYIYNKPWNEIITKSGRSILTVSVDRCQENVRQALEKTISELGFEPIKSKSGLQIGIEGQDNINRFKAMQAEGPYYKNPIDFTEDAKRSVCSAAWRDTQNLKTRQSSKRIDVADMDLLQQLELQQALNFLGISSEFKISSKEGGAPFILVDPNHLNKMNDLLSHFEK